MIYWNTDILKGSIWYNIIILCSVQFRNVQEQFSYTFIYNCFFQINENNSKLHNIIKPHTVRCIWNIMKNIKRILRICNYTVYIFNECWKGTNASNLFTMLIHIIIYLNSNFAHLARAYQNMIQQVIFYEKKQSAI